MSTQDAGAAAAGAAAIAAKDASAAASSSAAAGGGGAPAGAASERPKAAAAGGGNSVANTANQILFKNELYTSMKQKTMDHELMARLNKEAQEAEKKKFEKAKVAVARLENKRKVLIGVGDMLGPPGCDPSAYSSATVAVALAPLDTVRDVKKKLIAAAGWTDETPSDFGLFDDVSEEPLKDGQPVEATLLSLASLSGNNPSSSSTGAGKGGSRRGGGSGGGSRAPAVIRVPRPYVGVLWAARD